jgi:hypothetical protein
MVAAPQLSRCMSAINISTLVHRFHDTIGRPAIPVKTLVQSRVTQDSHSM